MTRSVSTNPPVPMTPSPQPREVRKPQEPARPVAKGDRLDVGNAPMERLVEADLRLRVAPSAHGAALLGNGSVAFNRVFVERVLKLALSQSSQVKHPQIAFHPATRSYAVQASLTVKGIDVPFSVRIKPALEGNDLGFKLENLRIPVGATGRYGIEHQWLTGKVCDELAKQLKWDFGAQSQPDKATVSLNPNALLQYIGALPNFLRLDMDQTRMQAGVSATGDLNLVLRTPGMAPAVNSSPRSDITVEAEEAGLASLLKGALAPDYEVQGVSLDLGGGEIDGRAEFKEGSDLITAGKLLVALIGLASGDHRAANTPLERSRLMVPLDLKFKLEGTQMVITPSISKAVGEISKSLEAAGLSPRLEGNSLRVDLDALWKNRGQFDAIDLRQDNMNVRMKLDLDKFYDNPILKGAQADTREAVV